MRMFNYILNEYLVHFGRIAAYQYYVHLQEENIDGSKILDNAVKLLFTTLNTCNSYDR